MFSYSTEVIVHLWGVEGEKRGGRGRSDYTHVPDYTQVQIFKTAARNRFWRWRGIWAFAGARAPMTTGGWMRLPYSTAW